MAVLRPLEDRDRELSGRADRGARGRQPSGRSGGGHAQDPLRPRALCRARRLHGEPAEEVLPPLARPRGAAALCLFRHLPRGGEGRGRRGGRAALHLRSGDARRQRARRAQGAGDPALGRCSGRRTGRGAALQPAVHAARPERRRLCRRPQSGVARGADRRPARAGAGRDASPARRCSSSGWAISAATPTRRRASSCSTERSACATPGRRCRAGKLRRLGACDP